MKIFSIFLILLLPCFSIAQETDAPVLISNFGKLEGANFSNSKLSQDGNTLEVNVNNKNVWNSILSAPLILKPNTEYSIYLDANIKTEALHSFLSLLVKDASTKTNIAELTIKNTASTVSNHKVSFKTPETLSACNLYIISRFKANGTLSNFKLKEGSHLEFVRITKNKKRFSLDTTQLPTGAKEFDVMQPNNPTGEIVEAKRFGIVPNKKLAPKLFNDALKYCKEKHAQKLIFEKDASYYFEGDETILIKDHTDFVIDGNNSTFIFYKKKGNFFSVYANSRIRFENINIDWNWEKSPLASIVKIKAISESKKPDEFYIDYEFQHLKKHPLYNQYVRAIVLSAWNPETESVGIENGLTLYYESSFSHGDNQVTKQKWISENTLRIYGFFNTRNDLEVGQLYRMQHYYYHMTHLSMYANRHITFKNYTIYGVPGAGFRVGPVQRWTWLDNVKIIRRPNMPERPITTTADHFFVERSNGYFKIENCEFSCGADDCINIHDHSMFGEKKSPNSVVTLRDYGSNGKPLEIRNADMSPTGLTIVKKETKKLPDGNVEVFFETPLPEGNAFLFFDRSMDSSNVIIRNSKFHRNRARGILILTNDVTIENCEFFRNEMGALRIETGYNCAAWYEGYGVNNVVVRNCTFDTVNPVDEKGLGYVRDVQIAAYMKFSEDQTSFPILKNILFENNTFKDTFGMIATIGSIQNLIFHKNTFKNPTARKNPLDYRGQFFVTHAKDVKIINNKFISSEHTKKLGVLYDKETSQNILVQGNRIVKEKTKKE